MNEPRPAARSLATITPKVTGAWYVACLSTELRRKPLARVIWDLPIAVFRGEDGSVGAFVDRCPHRSVPLSFGEVVGNSLQCGYHGWRFDKEGNCLAVPGSGGEPAHPARCATALPVVEQQGFVWVWPDPTRPPEGEPFRFKVADDPSYLTVRKEVAAPGTLHSVLENALDVPHTAFLHRGLFRNDGARREIRCVVTRERDRVTCEYVGEKRPDGLAARLLAPSGGALQHFDRFILPSITEVEYKLGEDAHVVLNGACTPVNAFDTKMYAVVSVKSRVPRWLVRPLIQPIALRIFGQDAEVLALQTATLKRFEDASYVSTELDVLGAQILRLLKRAEKGELGDDEPYTRETSMWV